MDDKRLENIKNIKIRSLSLKRRGTHYECCIDNGGIAGIRPGKIHL